MESRCIRVKLKKNSIDEVRAWFKELNIRKDEVLNSMNNEGIVVEAAFLDSFNGEYYLIYYIKSFNVEKAMTVFNKSNLSIDDFYKRKWNDLCEESVDLEELLDVGLE